MRKLLALTCLMALSTAVFAEFDNISFRMQGINPNLSGIVVDEYTDVFRNPADILSVSGYRFYTQFANLSGKGDRMFNSATTGLGGTVAGDNFQFGMIGNPLIEILPNAQLGLFVDQGSAITAKRPGNFAGATDGEATEEIIRSTEGVTAISTKKYGKRELEESTNDITAILGLDLTDTLKLGFQIQSSMGDSKEPINASYTRNDSSATSATSELEVNTLNAKEEITNNDITLKFGARSALSDVWNVGATLSLAPQKREKKRSSVSSRYMNVDRLSLAGDSVSTLNATGTDIAQITAAITGANAVLGTALRGIYDTNDVVAQTLAGSGFAWTDGAALLNDGNMDADSVGTVKKDGTAIGLGLDTYYKLNDETTLFAGLNFINNPLDIKINARNGADVQVTNWNDTALSSTSVVNISNRVDYIGSGDEDTNEISLKLGAEQILPADVRLAYGIIYTTSDTDMKAKYTQTNYQMVSLDATGDGLILGDGTAAGDSRVTVTETDQFQFKQQTKTNTYDFPIGMELQANRKLKLRLGVNHRVQETTVKSHGKRIADGLSTTVVEAGGAAASETIENAALVTGDVLQNSLKTVNKTRVTQYYYGAGYQWSENLSFDILNFSGAGSGAGILDLASWRVGATLLFGGNQ